MNVELLVNKETTIYGLYASSSIGTQASDIGKLCKEYYQLTGKKGKDSLPFYVLSEDYNEQTKGFTLFVGSRTAYPGLTAKILPEGIYGRTAIKPMLGFLWGTAIGAAKRKFYTKWIASSDFVPANMEFEMHTKKSMEKHPQIDLLFALKTKCENYY